MNSSAQHPFFSISYLTSCTATTQRLGGWVVVDQRWKKGWKPGRNFPESFQVWQKVLGQIIGMMSHFLIRYKTDFKSAPITEKYICHNFCLVTWKSLLLKHFFISKSFLQMKFPFLLLFNSLLYFSQKHFSSSSQKHFCTNWFYRRRIKFLSLIYWNWFMQKQFFNTKLFLQLKFFFCLLFTSVRYLS